MKDEESDIFKRNVQEIVGELYKERVKKIKEKEVLFYRLDEPEVFLNWAVLNNFLLHGSTRKIVENLKPYKANDKIKESGNRLAIYITRVPMVAMFCALTGGVDGLARRHSSHTKIVQDEVSYDEMYFGVSDINKVASGGFIYILGKDQVDEEANGEFLAYREVSPLAILEINRKDFPFDINIFDDNVN